MIRRTRFSQSVAVVDAPSSLGLSPVDAGHQPGAWLMPASLRARNLVERIGAADAGCVHPPEYQFAVDPVVGVRNGQVLASYSRELAERLLQVLDADQFPLVLGGDCAVLLGSALALQRRGSYGLVFVDGHQDLLTTESSPRKGAAGMDLALVCGVGPQALTHLGNVVPLFDPADVLLLGDRSGDGCYPGAEVQSLRGAMFVAGLSQWREQGITTVLEHGLAKLHERGVERGWLHLDLDVLDDDIMPAVDSRQPGGLTADELQECLTALLCSGFLAGMQLTIYDPEKDPTGAAGDLIVQILESAFQGSRNAR